ncbi:MAG: hydantoinase/oxoprolinase family protein [Lautropia sp.]
MAVEQGESRRYTAGVDIGGTFTDVVLLGDDGRLHTRKVLSTPDDYGRGIVGGIVAALGDLGAHPSQVLRVVHATTVATNAILEHRGARVGLVTTAGFRDVLEMRRLRIPEMYTLNFAKPEPLVPRRLRLEVRGRLGPKGEEWAPLDEGDVVAAARQLAQAGVEAVAISLLHAYANPAHEQRTYRILREHLSPEVFLCCSSDILPVIREYERTSTTVINAYLGPILRRYFESLHAHLRSVGIRAPLQVMKSDGGIMSAEIAAEKPAYLVESGPAAGVIGAARFGQRMALADCIAVDMGGTTAKASMVEGGEVPRTGDYEVGAGINLSSRLVMGGGYALKLPVIDISEIGAGGGSIVEVDAGGLLRVGPRSAGSMPGPVAYGLGGADPTFTDAVTTLGYLNPGGLVGGGLKLDAEAARRALQERVAEPLGEDVLRAAWGVFEIACGTMTRAVKAVTTYRGRDPRDFALFGFGGNGPVVAAHIATMMEMRHVVIPPHPGVFSAVGLLVSDVEHERVHGFLRSLGDLAEGELTARFRQLEHELARAVADERGHAGSVVWQRLADLRYAGQAHELTVPVPEAPGPDGAIDPSALAEAFAAEHERTYGHRSEREAVECVTIRVVARIAAGETDWIGRLGPGAGRRPDGASAAHGRTHHHASGERFRNAHFGPKHGLMRTAVIDRAELPAHGRSGPLIVEEYDSTVVVPPGWRARLDAHGSIHLEAE